MPVTAGVHPGVQRRFSLGGAQPADALGEEAQRGGEPLTEGIGLAGERRNQHMHPVYAKPELLATAHNQVWSWDIERHEALSTVR